MLPILAVSGTLNILNNVLRNFVFKDINVLIYKFLYSFIVLAFAEELVKYLVFRFLLKKKYSAYT